MMSKRFRISLNAFLKFVKWKCLWGMQNVFIVYKHSYTYIQSHHNRDGKPQNLYIVHNMLPPTTCDAWEPPLSCHYWFTSVWRDYLAFMNNDVPSKKFVCHLSSRADSVCNTEFWSEWCAPQVINFHRYIVSLTMGSITTTLLLYSMCISLPFSLWWGTLGTYFVFTFIVCLKRQGNEVLCRGYRTKKWQHKNEYCKPFWIHCCLISLIGSQREN